MRWALLALGVGTLELIGRLEMVDRITWVPLSTIGNTLIREISDVTQLRHVGYSFRAVAIAFGLSVLIGSILGIFLDRFRRIERLVNPYVQTYYAIPIFVFYPVFVVFFGLGIEAIVLIAFLYGFAAVTVETVVGLKRVSSSLVKYAKSLGMSGLSILLRIRLPSALPSMFAGFRVALVHSIAGVIASEFILATQGIGRVISDNYTSFRTAEMYAWILVVVAIALSANGILSRAERRVRQIRGIFAGTER